MLSLTAGVAEYKRFCTVLTAYAESDFKSDAVQGESVGVFQQIPRFWVSATKGTRAQCLAFMEAFDHILRTGDPVTDCWLVQRWAVPDSRWPDPGSSFLTATETQNYTRRLGDIPAILSSGRLP